ncbi:MAG TPA: aldo/keto reductase [Clostridia bacterium]
MKYFYVETIDGSKLKVAKYVLGSTAFPGLKDDEKVFEIIDRFLELGGNAIDTARSYGGELDQRSFGLAEGYIGRYIRARKCRDKVIVITKGGFPELNPDLSFKRLRISREAILGDFYTSYDNLRIGPIDIYLLHRDNPSLPVSYIMDTLHEIVDSGCVKAIGVSNWSMERILEANAYAESKRKAKLTVSEIMWGYAYINHEMRKDPSLSIMNPELYKQYEKHRIPILAFTSQSGGLFPMLHKGIETWETLSPIRKIFDCPENRAKLLKVNEYCAKYGVSAAALVTAYLACNKVECAPIIGCMSIEELEDTMSGSDLNLDQATIDWMDDVKYQS